MTGRDLAHVAHAEEVMGTVVSFRVVPTGAVPADRVPEVLRAACDVLHRADAVFSTWDPRSPVSRLRRGESSLAAMPGEVHEVLELCRIATERSGGWFDPWAMPGGVDPTGLVKGWAVERALEVLVARGVESALVNAGGDLVAAGRPAPGAPWRAGVRHPWRADALACVVRLERAVATSGSYERGPHLVNPRTGRPSSSAASATVAGPSLALADALATALAVGGDDVLARLDALDGYEAYLVRADGSEAWTDHMPFEEPVPEPRTA